MVRTPLVLRGKRYRMVRHHVSERHISSNTFPPPLAKDNDFDVVLIDTAGRMQDNEVLHFRSPSLLTLTYLCFEASHESSCQTGRNEQP